MILAAVLAAGITLAGAAPASAHAALVSSSPAAGSVVERPPTQVRLTFSEPVEVGRDTIVVIGPDGQPLPSRRAGTDPKDRTTVVAGLPTTMASGTYRVRYRVLSIDGHVVAGEIRFGVRHATASLVSSPESTGSSTPSYATVLPRALGAAGALALAGLLAFAFVVVAAARRTLPAPVGVTLTREVVLRLRVPVLLALTAGVVGGVLTAVDTVDQATGAVRIEDLGTLLTSTRTGVLISSRIALLLLAFLFFVGARRKIATEPHQSGRLAGGLAASVLGLLTLSLSGHSAVVAADRGVAVAFDAFHLAAVGLWIGGLIGLGLVGLPAARAAGAGQPQLVGDAAAALARSFSTAAQLAMLVVLGTGGYLALLQVTAVRQLTGTVWGEALTIKVALWVTVLLVATLNAVTLVPKMSNRAARSHSRWAASESLASAARLELGFGLLLVGVASLMAAAPPPAAVAASSGFAATTAIESRSTTATGSGAGYDVRVHTTRVATGGDTAAVFRVRLFTQGTPASAPRADAVLRGPDGVDRTLSLRLVGAGEWLSDRLSVAPGRYRLTPRFVRAGDEVDVPVGVQVP